MAESLRWSRTLWQLGGQGLGRQMLHAAGERSRGKGQRAVTISPY